MKTFKWNNTESTKNNFLARIIGLIGEDITDCWIKNIKSPFKDYGRPTIKWNQDGTQKKATLDFLFKKKNSLKDEYYIVEQKNLFARKEGRIRTIQNEPKFIKAYESWDKSKTKSTNAWDVFKNYKNKEIISVETKKPKRILTNKIIGSILIWSDADIKGDTDFINEFKRNNSIDQIIFFTSIIKDLILWKDEEFRKLIDEREMWIQELFKHLR